MISIGKRNEVVSILQYVQKMHTHATLEYVRS